MKKTNFLCVLVLVVGFVLGFSPALQAAWVGNSIGGGAGGTESSSEAESFVIDGASYFLRSYSDIFLLLNESEAGLKTGFNLDRAHQQVQSALSMVLLSRSSYSRALVAIRSMDFDPGWMQALKAFDYQGLAAARHLHPIVMDRVAGFLKSGDVIGLYQQFMDDLKTMSTSLLNIDKDAKKGIVPGMETLRTLYQDYSDFMLFGYYTSLVFSEIETL